ncbi:hypothetical protein [Chondromyces apiculatus]|uniref:hypothetical protein n=1 Tax=Chondromyces apiculatus TaxID=51 RepID=UPI0005C48D41|nr:hypothetical protein [Chondromyces apiculatus]
MNLEKYKAAKTLSGDSVRFELRAVRPAGSSGTSLHTASSCLVCLICIICIVCSVATAKETGLKLPPL